MTGFGGFSRDRDDAVALRRRWFGWTVILFGPALMAAGVTVMSDSGF